MSDQAEVIERLVRAEEGVKAAGALMLAQHAAILAAVNQHGTRVEELEAAHNDRLKALEDALTRYQGAWGAITLILSAVGVAWALFGGWVKARLGLEP